MEEMLPERDCQLFLEQLLFSVNFSLDSERHVLSQHREKTLHVGGVQTCRPMWLSKGCENRRELDNEFAADHEEKKLP